MSLRTWFDQNDKSGVGLVASLGISMLIVVTGFFYIFSMNRAHERSAAPASLRQRCDSEYGVFVEGMSGAEGYETHFSLCIPERAFECIDVVDVE